MMNKILLTIIAFTLGLHSFQQELNVSERADENPEDINEVIGLLSSTPPVESILLNPAIEKKQTSRHNIKAIGEREGSQKHFVIHFRKQQLHGDWQSFFTNNQGCDSGRFEKNLPDGLWKTWYSNGNVKTVRTYNAEKYYYIKSDLQRNHPKDQRYFITKYAREQKKISQHFQPSFETVQPTFPLTMLQKIEFNTMSDVSYVAPFKTCVHHGLFMNYYENGLVKDSGNYVNGLKHELWEESNEDGSERAFGFYRHGIRHGHWKYYDTSGKLVATEHFDENGRPGRRHYFRK